MTADVKFTSSLINTTIWGKKNNLPTVTPDGNKYMLIYSLELRLTFQLEIQKRKRKGRGGTRRNKVQILEDRSLFVHALQHSNLTAKSIST